MTIRETEKLITYSVTKNGRIQSTRKMDGVLLLLFHTSPEMDGILFTSISEGGDY